MNLPPSTPGALVVEITDAAFAALVADDSVLASALRRLVADEVTPAYSAFSSALAG